MTEFDKNSDRQDWLKAFEPPSREDFAKPIVDALIKRRHELGLSQEQVNIKLGMADRYVNKWECGMKTPNLYNLMLWCSVLGLKIEITEI